MLGSKYIITDVGSTTTKAIMLETKEGKLHVAGVANSKTTVESPWEDVNIGIYNSIKQLEEETGKKILKDTSTNNSISFTDEFEYLTTSSAGGGLQILVIGLTLFDSAKSAERAAYGAGGVILDTLAINDKRSTYEQLQVINRSHPDIILFSGGTDGGAFSGVVRLAEILSLGKPSPKFTHDSKIPLIYAGNKDAQEFVKTLFNKNFDAHILPNIRPSMDEEKLDEVTEVIHELFLSSVMEQAPGYSKVKQIVSSDIIPTPVAVLHSLNIIKEKLNTMVMKVDIGGATTDIFSVINGKTNRTVSANYGMSYSISNILLNAGWDSLKALLPEGFNEREVRNYIGSKMLNPIYTPSNDTEICIEQAIAILGLRLSMEQHLDMHYNTLKVGFLERVKSYLRDPFYDQMYQSKVEEKSKFHQSDINIVIGAGGVISHAPTKKQALYIISEGFKVQGITQVWRDFDFISPHIGKLSEIDKDVAHHLLETECYENLGTVITPYVDARKDNELVLTVKVGNEATNFYRNQLKYINIEKEVSVEIKLEGYTKIRGVEKKHTFTTDKPILINTFMKNKAYTRDLLEELQLYNLNDRHYDIFQQVELNENYQESGTYTESVSLPYKGSISVELGQSILPDDNFGVNEFSFPKIYIVSLAKLVGKSYLDNNNRPELNIKVGDEVKYGQEIAHNIFSPVKGKVTTINEESGTILMREIQKYSTKPVTIEVAKKYGIKNKDLRGYIVVKKNEFVFEGQRITKINTKKYTNIIKAPITGYVTDINIEKGTVTIQYKKEPTYHKVGLQCSVTDVTPNYGIEYEFTGSKIKGTIGFGSNENGDLKYIEDFSDLSSIKDKVVVCNIKPSLEMLKKLNTYNIKGLVVPSVDNIDIVSYIGKDIGVALTGNEVIPYPVILMKGFGDYKFDKKFIETIKSMEGQNCKLIPMTQVRAGVTRPKLVINH